MSALHAESPDDDAGPVSILAPAKLTLSLRVVGVRSDGYHLLDAEMVTIDLADTLQLRPGDRLRVRADVGDRHGEGEGQAGGDRPGEGQVEVEGHEPNRRASGRRHSWSVPEGPDNLVRRALRAVGRRADVELVKRVPPGAGLGGGSADAAAVLRWAGCDDPAVAVALGADVPFCLTGGRARVRGVGEEIEALPFAERTFTLLLPPFGMDTTAVYRAWDRLTDFRDDGLDDREADGVNDLEPAALVVDGRLAGWKQMLTEVSGCRPRLAGSGSTWFLEGGLGELGLPTSLALGGEQARLVEVRTVPAFA